MKGIDPAGYYVIGDKSGITKIFSGPYSDYWSASMKKPIDWSWSLSVKSGTELMNEGIQGYNEFGIVSKKPKSGLESIADSVREYQRQRMEHEREMEQIRIAAQKEAEERARRERINIFNKTHKNLQTGYDVNNEDVRKMRRLQTPSLTPTGARATGTLLGGALGGFTGAGLGTALGAIKRLKPMSGALAGIGAGIGTLSGGIAGYNIGKKSDVAKYAKLENERKANLSIAKNTVKKSYLDEINPSIYYVIEYNEDAYNKGLHKVLKGFADKTHALNYRNNLRQRGIEAFVNKGSTLLAKGVDLTGIINRG